MKTIIDYTNALKSYFGKKADVQALANYTANMGVKNILALDFATIKSLNAGGTWTGNAYVQNGVTFTVSHNNGNVTGISINGTASAATTFALTPEMDISQFNKMVMNGNMIADDTVAILRLEMTNSPWTGYSESNNADVTIGTYAAGTVGRLFIRVFNGKTVTNQSVYPMLRDASISDATYAPYAEPNTTLTSQNQALTNQLTDEVTTRSALGAHNLLRVDLALCKADTDNNGTWASNVYSKNSVDITVYDDGQIKVNGTPSATFVFVTGKQPIGNIASGMKYSSGGASTSGNYVGVIDYYNTSIQYISQQILTDGTALTVPNNCAYFRYSVVMYKDKTADNVVFKSMIRLATDADTSYQPYAKTNLELTDVVTSMNSDLTVPSDVTSELGFVTSIVNQVKDLIEDGKSISGVVTWTGHDRYAYTVTRSSSTRLFFTAYNNSAIYFGKQDGDTISGKYVTGTAIS